MEPGHSAADTGGNQPGSVSISTTQLMIAATDEPGTVTVTNPGDLDLTGLGFELVDNTNLNINAEASTCDATNTLASGQECVIVVNYTGTAPADKAD